MFSCTVVQNICFRVCERLSFVGDSCLDPSALVKSHIVGGI